jgi:hypothetical protein
MTAYYYSIIKLSTNNIIDEGIIRDAEDIIYPGQNTDSMYGLPFECEAHHFYAKGYKLIGWSFEISGKDLIKFKL